MANASTHVRHQGGCDPHPPRPSSAVAQASAILWQIGQIEGGLPRPSALPVLLALMVVRPPRAHRAESPSSFPSEKEIDVKGAIGSEGIFHGARSVAVLSALDVLVAWGEETNPRARPPPRGSKRSL